MKKGNPKTSKWHKYEEGDCAAPIGRDGSKKCFYKKGFWKRYDRKKYYRNMYSLISNF